jgi:hypothetical protein
VVGRRILVDCGRKKNLDDDNESDSGVKRGGALRTSNHGGSGYQACIIDDDYVRIKSVNEGFSGIKHNFS